MRVAFESSHVRGGYPDGRLTVRVSLWSDASHRLRPSDVWFSVPPDFHTHNDAVAAALLTLVGRRYPSVTFNFPISRFCADTLAGYYQLSEIGPIDEGLEARRPGRHLALNFSGGVDSTALWVLLREVGGIDFKVVTTEYERNQLDQAGFRAYQRDVSCLTNLRTLHLDLDGRFNCAVPLLFADYLDLWGVASGHTYEHDPFSMERLRDGQPPAFLVQDAALAAGGLADVHVIRGLTEIGVIKILVEAAPERLEQALEASDFSGTRKRATKSLAARFLFEREGRPAPGFLRDIPLPRPASGRRRTTGLHFRSLWEAKHFGLDFTEQIEPRVRERDLSFLDAHAFEFFERYHTSLTGLIPAALRPAVLRAFHQVRLYPYAERDFQELEIICDFIGSDGGILVAPSLLDHTPAIARV